MLDIFVIMGFWSTESWIYIFDFLWFVVASFMVVTPDYMMVYISLKVGSVEVGELVS